LRISGRHRIYANDPPARSRELLSWGGSGVESSRRHAKAWTPNGFPRVRCPRFSVSPSDPPLANPKPAGPVDRRDSTRRSQNEQG
jgi:hypothetical protein